MAFFRVYPRQAETMYYPPREVIGDAILAGLAQGMNEWDQLLGPYHRARSCQRPSASGATPKERTTRRVPTSRDPPAAWMWWMLSGDSSDSEEEEAQAPGTKKQGPRCQGPCPRGRPQCSPEESCAMKRKPSRSASNAPPKKKEDKKTDEDAPKFHFTGRKTTEKSKTEKKESKKSEKKPEAEVVLVKPAPWKFVVQVSEDFGPEDVKVYVKDERIRVEGRRERNVGEDIDVVECLEVNRELQPPSDVILDDLSVFFRSGGRLELEAPRKVQGPKHQPELVKRLESMSVMDIEKDAATDENETQETEAASQDEDEKADEVQKVSDEEDERAEDERTEEKDEHPEDWEMLPEDENKDNETVDEAKTEDDIQESEDVREKLEEAAEEEEKQEETDVKISEIEEITTKPIVEEPSESADNNAIATEEKPTNLVVRIVSEDQQQTQIDENAQLLVMNLTGFEPRDVTVTSEGDRVSVRAVRETEEEGFLSRKESFRSFRVADPVKISELTCTMGPEAKLVITSPSA